MKNHGIWLGWVLIGALCVCGLDARGDEIVVRLIQATNKKAAADPELSDVLPKLKALRWSHYQQVAVRKFQAKESGTERLALGARLKLALTYKGLQGKQLAMDVKLLLDDKEALQGNVKLGGDPVCIGGQQAGDEGWIIYLERR